MVANKLGRKETGLQVRKSKIHGLGVFAKRNYAEGEVILRIDDSHPVPDRSRVLPEQEKELDVFVDVDGNKRVVFMNSPEKYINTSCNPNLVIRTDMETGVRRVIALRNIGKGEEITFDYALNSDEDWETPVPCNCGSPNCRGMIRGNFFTLPRDVQLRYIPLLDEPFKRKYKGQIESLSLQEADR